MEKKYQVFISSTYADLVEERKKVLDILLMADCIPAGMEAFVATDSEQFEVIKKVIDLCDYYVLIIGKRYGSINETTGISYTEMEYDYAIDKGIPVLVFALDDSVNVSAEKEESDPKKIKKLREFRTRALSNRLASIWHSDTELTGQLAIAIMKAKAQINRPGWQRGADYDEVSFRREIMSLQEDNSELRKLLSEKDKIISDFNEETDLAFDNQPITIPYEYTYWDPYGTGYQTEQETLETDLKTIFTKIATEMINGPITEEKATETLENELPFNKDSTIQDTQFTKRMLNQFRALSLVTSKADEKEHIIYWSLTPKGEKVRDEAILIKKNKQ